MMGGGRKHFDLTGKHKFVPYEPVLQVIIE